MAFTVHLWDLLSFSVIRKQWLEEQNDYFDQSLFISRDIKSTYDYQYESLGEIADLLVAMSEERLRHTVNYLQRLYFNKIFKKKEKDNGSGADVVTKRKKIFSMMWRKGSQLGKKLYSLN